MSNQPPPNSRNWSKRERYWCVSPTTGQGYWRYKGVRETVIDIRDKRPYQYSKTDPHYLRYHKRKMKIRNEYPLWNAMERNQWKEYYTQIFELVHTDTDYKHFWEITNERFIDKKNKELMERKIARGKAKPNGWMGDEY
jgi:hypothetical protein